MIKPSVNQPLLEIVKHCPSRVQSNWQPRFTKMAALASTALSAALALLHLRSIHDYQTSHGSELVEKQTNMDETVETINPITVVHLYKSAHESSFIGWAYSNEEAGRTPTPPVAVRDNVEHKMSKPPATKRGISPSLLDIDTMWWPAVADDASMNRWLRNPKPSTLALKLTWLRGKSGMEVLAAF